MDSKDQKTLKFVKANLLGKKRDIVENIIQEDQISEGETIEGFMKEIETETTVERAQVIEDCNKLLQSEPLLLDKEKHLNYLQYAINNSYPSQLTALDASQPWMVYWITNSLKILDSDSFTDAYKLKIIEKFELISKNGGPYGGGPNQLPHIAGTYAAINALSLVENYQESWTKINRTEIYNWLLKLKQPNGGFNTCLPVGENDTRGVYCALSVASLLNILTPELCENVVDYLVRCQTFEGGFGGSPQEDEAHGGYTFCAVASLLILDSIDKINVESLLNWCSSRQCDQEKGFNGRNNKLVDGCYSFWVGAVAAILEAESLGHCMSKNDLHQYICQCCQSLEQGGGLRDKPNKNADFYHTNYVLMGLALCDSKFYIDKKSSLPKYVSIKSQENDESSFKSSNLQSINPVYGLPAKDVVEMYEFFQKLGPITQ